MGWELNLYSINSVFGDIQAAACPDEGQLTQEKPSLTTGRKFLNSYVSLIESNEPPVLWITTHQRSTLSSPHFFQVYL